jgi:hypothetical protein
VTIELFFVPDPQEQTMLRHREPRTRKSFFTSMGRSLPAAIAFGTALAVSAPAVASAHSGAHNTAGRPNAVTAKDSTRATAATDAKAAELRAALTALLQEHVYLAGIATGTALSGGDLTPPAQALDANSVALADAISSVYGNAAGEQFLALWRTHIQFFVDYTTAAAKGDSAGKAKAAADLDQYRNDFGAFLASANPNLTKEAVAKELAPHVTSMFAAIDAQAAKNPMQYELLREAASHMPMTAKVLSGAIAAQFPKRFKR